MGCDISPSQPHVHSHGWDIKCAVLSDFSFRFIILLASFYSKWSSILWRVLSVLSQTIEHLYCHGMSCPFQAIHVPFSFLCPFLVSLCLHFPGSHSHMFLTQWMWQWVHLPSRERRRLFPPTRWGFFTHQSGQKPASSLGLVFISMRSICAMFSCLLWAPQWLWPIDILR